MSTAVVVVRIPPIAAIAIIVVSAIVAFAAVIRALSIVTVSVIAVPYRSDHAAAERGEKRKNEKVFHVGCPFE
jgi:hypothetical protein